MRRVITVVFAASVLVGLATACASAQSQSCKVYFSVSWYCESGPNCIAPWPIPAGAQYVGNCGPWCGEFWVWGNKCRPPRPRCNHCQRSGAPPEAGQPIDLASGNTSITQTDIHLPGLGGGLTLTRTWNSVPSTVYASGAHMFGVNWQSTYEDRLVLNTSDGFITEETGGEDETAFGFAGFSPTTYSIVAPANKIGTLITNTDTTKVTSFTLTSMDGEKRTYDPTRGALLAITDRNGNTTQLAYDATNRLTTVTDAASRHLNFTYQSSTSNLVTTVSSDAGITLSYAYDSQGRLTKVTKPDNTTVSFQYDAQNRITAVLDNDGKVLESHTYDAAGRGLSSSRANGVDSVTVAYPQ
jgi:YD repeat-containing protein